MEEAEALCTKMGIMVAGNFKCFGTSQHIKNKYGTGYEIEAKIKTLNEDEVSEIRQKNNISVDVMTLDQINTLCNSMEAPELIQEIKANGVG